MNIISGYAYIWNRRADFEITWTNSDKANVGTIQMYSAYHNHVKPYRIGVKGEEMPHAERAGGPFRVHRKTMEAFFHPAAFYVPHKCKQIGVAELIPLLCATPMKHTVPRYPRYAAAGPRKALSPRSGAVNKSFSTPRSWICPS